MRTTFTREIEASPEICTEFAQNPARTADKRVRFPVTIRHRTGTTRIYAPGKNFAYYRMCFTAAGKRQMQTFGTYSEAKAAAEKKAKEIHENSVGASLTASQAQDALAAMQRLENFRVATGRRLSLLGAVSELVENLTKLKNFPLGEAVDTFLRNSAVVQPKDIGQAVTDFLGSKEHLTRAADGKRAQLSAKYAYVLEKQLRRFADTFPGTAVCDLSKAHLDKFISTLGEQATKSRNKRKITSAKSRNHYRGVIRQFLAWCVRKDYLSPAHRLFEADNVQADSFMATFKTECFEQTPATRDQARLQVLDYLEPFYNPKRLHSALGYQSPVEFEKQFV